MKNFIYLSTLLIIAACGGNPKWDGTWTATLDKGQLVKMVIIGNPEDPVDEKIVNITIDGKKDRDANFCKMVKPITKTANINCFRSLSSTRDPNVLNAEISGNKMIVNADGEVIEFKRN